MFKFLRFCFVLVLCPISMASAQDFVPGEVLVKLKDGGSVDQVSKALSDSVYSKSQKDIVLSGSYGNLNIHKFSLKPGQDVHQVIQMLKADPDVEYAEPNYYLKKQELVEDQQAVMSYAQAVEANFENFSGGFSQTLAPIQVEEAWNQASSGSGDIVVAIIDTGVDYNHQVFQGSQSIWENPYEIAGNGIDDDGNGYIDDIYGWNFVANSNNPMDDDNHGTHVAGIVLGITQNILASSLQTSTIKIMPLKFLDDQGVGTTSDAIAAINYAIDNGAHVLNNSWGGGGFSQSLEDAVARSNSEGISFVAASGNSSNNNDISAIYPASFNISNVISVAATTDGDALASFSNYGSQSVHIASPGVAIYSTLPSNSMGYASGTSMAAPFVSGLAAMMLREEPTLTGAQVKSVLVDTANTISSLDGKVSSGGRINAYNAVYYTMTGDATAYDPGTTTSRKVASSPSGAEAGCSALLPLYFGGSGGAGGGGVQAIWQFLTYLFLLMAPVLLIQYFKSQSLQSENLKRRKFQRYKIQSQAKMVVDGQQISGKISTISLGGVKFDTSSQLKQGDSIQIMIDSPDGKERIQVQGQVVWGAQGKKPSYGIAFTEIEDAVKSVIANWQVGLAKT